MKKKILVLLFCSFPLFTSKGSELKQLWQGYEVFFKKLKSGNQPWKIEFRDKYYGTILKTEVLSQNLIKYGNIKMDGKPVFYVISHNNGKKEGIYNVYIYYQGEYGIYSGKLYGLSGHDSPVFRDINHDNQYELKIANSTFTRFSVKHKMLGLCHLTEGNQAGIIGLYPKFYRLLDGNFQQVTFKPEYHKNLIPHILKTEQWLKTNQGRSLQMGYSQQQESLRFVEILQYYYYLTRLGSEKRAIEKIGQAKMKIKIHSCKNKQKNKVESPEISLPVFLKVFRQEILWEH